MHKSFISFSRQNEISQNAAITFETKMTINLDDTVFAPPFRDQTDISAGDLVKQRIDPALAECDFFICLLSDAYWMSDWCKYELETVVQRWSDTDRPRLLFVLVEPMNIHQLKVLNNVDRDNAVDTSGIRELKNLGQINFLGPYDPYGRLAHLNRDDYDRSQQVYDMVMSIGELAH